MTVMLIVWFMTIPITRIICTESTLPWELLPDNMVQFCPLKSICRERNVTKKYEVPDLDSMYFKCCQDCSCDKSCGNSVEKPCCYPIKDQDIDESSRQCLFSTTYNRYDTFSKYRSYFMSIKASDKTQEKPTVGEMTRHDTTKKSCDQTDVAPWGSLLPVYSKAKKLIYKNYLCAREDGVTDAIEWEVFLVCKYEDPSINRPFSPAQISFRANLYFEQCQTDFSPPSDIIEDVKQHICYKDVIYNCSSDYLTLPMPDNMTHEQVRRLCNSGFFSPYIVFAFGIYANVFCYICNSGKNAYPVCVDNMSLLHNRPVYNSYTLLLDMKAFVPRTKEDSQLQLACPIGSNEKDACRPALCPVGQIYDSSGHCKFPYTWSSMTLGMSVCLTPTRNITMNILKAVSESSKIGEYIKSPWSRGWKMVNVFAKDVPVLDTSFDRAWPSIIISMQIAIATGTDPETMMTSILETSKEPWIIKLPGDDIEAIQRLAPFSTMMFVFDRGYIPSWYYDWYYEKKVEEKSEDQKDLTYISLYERYVLTQTKLTIQKTFFCAMIELHEDEFEQSMQSGLYLYNMNHSEYLLENEYDLIRIDLRKHSPRICLEDARFEWQISVSSEQTMIPRFISTVLALHVCVVLAYVV